MNINVQTIPHDKHRYPTVGDWWFDDAGDLQIRVSDMGDVEYEALIALHEQVEAILCKQRGISAKQVDEFDVQFEKDRELGLHADQDEPGGHPDAPYRREHFFATSIERLMAGELNVEWHVYETQLNNLP